MGLGIMQAEGTSKTAAAGMLNVHRGRHPLHHSFVGQLKDVGTAAKVAH